MGTFRLNADHPSGAERAAKILAYPRAELAGSN
jgi:hypothetical protein